MAELLSFEDALARILDRALPLPAERVRLEHAAGRVLAQPALSRTDLPPFPSSAMDGYAVRVSDTPGSLPIATRVAAGSPAAAPLPAGAAATIATGGAVPEGADAVVPVERAAESDGRVDIPESASAGAHIRPRGGDVREGAVVVEPGVRLGAAQIGALAAAGIDEVSCSRRPRVAVLATGSELRAPGDRLEPGEIYESNRQMIAAVLESTSAEIELLPVVRDEESAHRAALEQGLAADVLVSSGGVSVGPHDLVRRIAAELGVEEDFWGVAVKPGKPLSFGVRGSTLVFGLPGNPVSSLVGALLFVRPALLAQQGVADPGPTFDAGRTTSALRRNGHRDEFVRARRTYDAVGVELEAIAGQESHMIVRASSADALVHVPRGSGEIDAGEVVRYVAV
ncbi:MAG: molybdopterin molybdotransferase MoeA [Gaiellaceae bacterium]